MYEECEGGAGEEDCGFRLVGLVAQGSIPWACVGIVALLLIAFLRVISCTLSDRVIDKAKGVRMHRNTLRKKLLGSAMLETVWAIVTSSAAGSLPA